MSRAPVERELAANCFRLASSFDDLPWQHLLTFVDADAPRKEPPAEGDETTGTPSDGQGSGVGVGKSCRCGRASGWPSHRRSKYPNPTRTSQLISVTSTARTY